MTIEEIEQVVRGLQRAMEKCQITELFLSESGRGYGKAVHRTNFRGWYSFVEFIHTHGQAGEEEK